MRKNVTADFPTTNYFGNTDIEGLQAPLDDLPGGLQIGKRAHLGLDSLENGRPLKVRTITAATWNDQVKHP
jgi:hypothetical protein